MFGKDLLIQKYPYLAFSPNVLEYFSIIGYQENFIPTLINSFKKKKNPYSPTTLSSITSSKDYGIVDNELIISQIYPDNPLIIPIITKNDITTEMPSTSNAIYSFCFDTTDGKSKLFYTCFSYKFYEKYTYKSNSNVSEYYIPKAFCIVSQYGFLSLFYYICKNIHTLIKKKNSNNDLPVELIIYNIVNFIPSPMSYNLHLDIFSFCMNVPDIEIKQLSGYPYIDFDLKEIFNIFPLNFFLEIYLISIIEQKMLFFSSNQELLNIFMYIIYILNYPCNDSRYFWHIVTVSKDNLIEENKFVGLMVSMLGVNSSYEESIDTKAFGTFYYIIDIDNKKIILKESLDISIDEKDEADNLNNLHQYIQSILKEKNVESSFLKPFIGKLKKSLELLLFKDKEEHSTTKLKNYKPDFFKMSKSIYENNRKIQEIFYNFCLNLLMIFYQDNTIVSSFDKIKRLECSLEEQNKKINALRINDSNIDMTNEEKNFMEFFRGAIKYKMYFENFIQNLDTVDVFKISLLFSEEFINLKIKDAKSSILSKISFFDIIDSLYYPSKQQTINITISNLFSLALDKLKKYFEEYSSKNINKDSSKPQLINLNRKIINKYLFLLNNFYEKEEIMDLFPSIRIQEEQQIIYFDRRYIINIILNTFENHNLITTHNYLIYALIYIFCISLSLHSYKKMITYLGNIINSLGKIRFFLRHFGYIILQTFFKYLIMNKEINTYHKMNITHIKMYYYMIITFLKQNNIIPNEEMMAIFSKFFGKMIFQERKNIHTKEDKEIDDETNFELKKNINFYCFMKHCFSNKKYFKSNTMIKSALKETNNCNIIIRSNKTLKPTVEIKINDYLYSTEFFSPKKIYKLAEISYNEFYENQNLNFSKLRIKNVRDCIANLIQYGLELKDSIPINFLIYTLYLLRNFEEKYANNSIERDKNSFEENLYELK